MKKDLGAIIALYPTPVYLVATYDKENKPNIMTVGWGGVCNSRPPCVSISVRSATHTYEGLMVRCAFTLNIASSSLAKAAAYCGTKSGREVNKFEALGLTPVKSTTVDAPYIDEAPVVLECKVIQIHEIGSHMQFIGEIVNVKMEEEFCDEQEPLLNLAFKPIVYAPGNNYRYFEVGNQVNYEKPDYTSGE